MTFTAQELILGALFVVIVGFLLLTVWNNRARFLAFDLSLLDDITSRLIQIGIAISIVSILVAAVLVPLGWTVKISVLGAQELLYIAGAFWLVSHAVVKKG